MTSTLLLLSALAATPSLSTRFDGDRTVGGAFAPAALPRGTLALWGTVGAPDVAAGYRQGFSGFELEARASFNLFEASALAEVGARLPVWAHRGWAVAPTAALGLWLNSGATYFDARNFELLAVRPRVGVVTSYAVAERVQALAMVDLAAALGANAWVVTPQLGAGAEFGLGNGFSVLAMGTLGADARRSPLGAADTRAAWSLRLGIGYRLF